ncbi:MAG: hypothetical protein IKZ53_02945 [Selenomonadaceae bacterium]|nr:hypothetical protein [Selenomonadaceae bacterium]
MIHVCFGLHDKTGRYSKFTGTAMLSLFDNTTSEVTVHILHDNTLTQDNRDKFIYLAGRYGQLVKFYNVEQLCADKISEMVNLVPAVKTARVSVGAFYRILIPQLLPDDIGKCIYLDSDIIVNLDITELWHTELNNKPLGAVPEDKASSVVFKTYGYNKYLIYAGFVDYTDYFNSGVLVMNLNYLREAEELIMSGVKWRGEHTQCNAFDQDIWNYLFSKNYLKLSGKFDSFLTSERLKNDVKNKTRKVIYHYAGFETGSFGLDLNDVFNRLWLGYFIKTPFFNEETIGRLYAGVQNLHVELKQSMINISAIMSGKTRAFFVTADNVDVIKKIFLVRGNEDIILAESEKSLKKLIDAMKKAKNKKVFFIIFPNFPFKILTDENFVPGKDFVNGLEFLSEAQGVPLNSYSIIQAM